MDFRCLEFRPEPIGVDDFCDVRDLLLRHLVVGIIIWLREDSVPDQGGKDSAGDYGVHPGRVVEAGRGEFACRNSDLSGTAHFPFVFSAMSKF